MSLAQIQSNAPQSMGIIPASGQNLAVSSSVVTLAAAARPDKTKMVMIQAQDAAIRMSTDGEDPTAIKGRLLSANDVVYISLRQANAAKFIRDGASDGVIYSEAMTY